MTSLEHFVRVYPDILTAEQCELLINFYQEHPEEREAGTVRRPDGPVIDMSVKLVEQLNIEVGTPEDDILAQGVNQVFRQYTKDVETYPAAGNQDAGYHIKCYHAGVGFYDWHLDNDVPYSAGRQMAVILYLNSVAIGGETEFKGGYCVAPVQGQALAFPANWLYPHRGHKPISGDKYIMNTFLGY